MNRRQFNALLAAGLAAPAGLTGGSCRAAPASERRFIFVFCDGGWDQTTVFSPTFDSGEIPDEAGAQPAEIGGLTFVDHEDRPSVRAFFEGYADRTAFLNGFEVPSIAHERCKQLLLTGRSDAVVDDWPSILAARSSGGLLLPSLVLSGPSFSADYIAGVVRLGDQGQLAELLSGEALTHSVQSVSGLGADAASLTDAYLRGRARAHAAAAGRGQPSRFAEHYADSLDDLLALQGVVDDLELEAAGSGDLVDRLKPAFSAFEAGLSRTAMVRFMGYADAGFDTHAENSRQSQHFEMLFDQLLRIQEALGSRPGRGGGALADEVVLVVCSEMGRTPQLNDGQGKDHWTYTSAMLVGPGVRWPALSTTTGRASLSTWPRARHIRGEPT